MLADNHHHKILAVLVGLLVLESGSTSKADLCDWLLGSPAECAVWDPCYGSGYGPGGYTPSYASSWKRVPLTVYRPAVIQSAPGAPLTTTLAPCDTFEWQARRVKQFSLQPRPVYWQSYNSPNQQTIPAYFRTDDACLPGEAADNGQTVTPYYERGETRLAPAPTSTPEASNPADQQPALDPREIRGIRGASADRPNDPRRGEASAISSLRGMPSAPPQPHVTPPRRTTQRPSSLTEGSRSQVEIPITAPMQSPHGGSDQPSAQAWDDSGWESAGGP